MRNLYFFILFFNTLPLSHLHSMQVDALDDIYQEWILMSTSEEENSTSEEDTNIELKDRYVAQNQNKNALNWAIKNGGPSKLIKLLAPPELRERFLHKARSNFIRKHGKRFALEAAIQQDNLYLIKGIINQTKVDKEFKATIFALAIFHRKPKTLRYMGSRNTDFLNQETIKIMYEFITKSINEGSLQSLKLLFDPIIIIHPLFQEFLVNHGLQECKKATFEKGTHFLMHQQKLFEERNPNLMINTF